MNKAELIDRVSEATGEARSRAGQFVEATFDAVQGALINGDRVVVPGFGTFTPRPRKARTGRNPQTGASVKIPATTIPVFKAGSTLKALVSGKAKLTVTRSGGSSAGKSSAKKSTAKKSAAKKSTAKAKPAAKSSAKKSSAKKSPAKKSTAKKTAAKKR